MFCIPYGKRDPCQITLPKFPFSTLAAPHLPNLRRTGPRRADPAVPAPLRPAATSCFSSWLSCGAGGSAGAAAGSLSEGGTTKMRLTAMSPGGRAPLARGWRHSKTRATGYFFRQDHKTLVLAAGWTNYNYVSRNKAKGRKKMLSLPSSTGWPRWVTLFSTSLRTKVVEIHSLGRKKSIQKVETRSG